jgi:hypothetical protein
MEFITKEDFTSHIYEEGMNKISRNDDKKIEGAIAVGMQVAARNLGRYDIDQIFATQGDDRLKYMELMTYIKDIAKWHFIAVANVQVDIELAEIRYKAALAELAKMKAGSLITGWPLPVTESLSTNFSYGSRPKFNYE